MPEGFDLADLEQAGVTLVWEDGRFVWDDADFSRFPLTLDGPPDAALGATVCWIRSAGCRARPAASRCRSSSSLRRRSSGGPATAGAGLRRAARPRGRHDAAASAARPGHLPARPHRRQNRLRQIDTAARPDHQSRPALFAPTRWNCTWWTSRKASSSRPMPLTVCRMPASSPSRASASSA